MRIVRFCGIFTFWLASWSLAGQSYVLEIDWQDVSSEDTLVYQTDTLNRMEAEAVLADLVAAWRMEDYWLASVDDWQVEGDRLVASLWRGPRLPGIQLDPRQVPPQWRDAVRIPSDARLYRFGEVAALKERLLTAAENRGYPLARVWIDSIQWEGAQATGYLRLDPGQLFTFGELLVEGDARISNNYLQHYLGIRPGTPYRAEQVRLIRDRLRDLPFLQEKQSPQLTFRDRTAEVKMFVERQRASRFDFLLGVLPTNNEGPDRRFLITGTLNAELQNAFGLGERIFASFEQLRPGTQDLELAGSYPYVLGLPFGVDVGLNQYRRDSTFNDLITDVGVRYLFAGGNFVRAFWNRTASSLLSVDQEMVINTRTLPATLDINNTTFGLHGQWQRLDYRFNPRRGWRLEGRAGIGIKRIEPNRVIVGLTDPEEPAFDFGSLYDTLTLQSVQYRATARVDRFWPVGSSGTVLARLRGGWISTNQPVYRNEQYRIGGNRLLRGFDEESLFVNLFAVLTLEYRLLLDRNSNMYVFFDYGYVEDATEEGFGADRPFGTGAGITFQTRAGLFGVSLAVGRQFDNPIDLRNPKVHFGYVNYF